jgi:coenzyme F420-reducing hydrogenase delta subunit
MTARTDSHSRPVVTVFHCVNTFAEAEELEPACGDYEIRSIKLACSSMVKDVFLLRAFEAGADVVLVFVCPEGECSYISGNIRASRRINRLKDLLDEIGLDRRRLALFNIAANDKTAAKQAIADILGVLKQLGANPAAERLF